MADLREIVLGIQNTKGQYSKHVMQPGITWIYDGINSSVYVVEAEEEAFVIDTAEAPESLTEYIRKEITTKPLTLVVTHGHGDHCKKADEFDRFFMSDKDDEMVKNRGLADLSKRINIMDGDVISIPGLDLVVIAAPGHTAGSVLFADVKHRCVFTGDALGGGRNLWMQLPGCTDLSVFAEAVRHAIDSMEALGVDETWTMYGGHYDQRYGWRITPGIDNVPGLPMFRDLATLCDKLVSGEIIGEVETADRSVGDQAYNAHYGQSEILYTLKQLK